MLKLGGVILMVFACMLVACTQKSLPAQDFVDKAWVHQDTPWMQAPKEIGIDEQTAYVQIAEFGADGSFSLVGAVLRRYGRQVSVSAGDGQVIFLGKWEGAGNEITVTYTKVFETMPAIGKAKSPSTTVTVRFMPGELLIGTTSLKSEGGIDLTRYRNEYVKPYAPSR